MSKIFVIKGIREEYGDDVVRIIGAVTDEIDAHVICSRLVAYREQCKKAYNFDLNERCRITGENPILTMPEELKYPSFPYDNVPKAQRTKEQLKERAKAKQDHKVKFWRFNRQLEQWTLKYNRDMSNYDQTISDETRKMIDDYAIVGYEKYEYVELNMLPKDFME